MDKRVQDALDLKAKRKNDINQAHEKLSKHYVELANNELSKIKRKFPQEVKSSISDNYGGLSIFSESGVRLYSISIKADKKGKYTILTEINQEFRKRLDCLALWYPDATPEGLLRIHEPEPNEYGKIYVMPLRNGKYEGHISEPLNNQVLADEIRRAVEMIRLTEDTPFQKFNPNKEPELKGGSLFMGVIYFIISVPLFLFGMFCLVWWVVAIFDSGQNAWKPFLMGLGSVVSLMIIMMQQ